MDGKTLFYVAIGLAIGLAIGYFGYGLVTAR